MLKCIVLLLSIYYYGLIFGHMEEIKGELSAHHTEIVLKKVTDSDAVPCASHLADEIKETLIITDEAFAASELLDEGRYVVVLYHDRNRYQDFPQVRYAIEDLLSLEYKSLEEIYQRLAGQPWEIFQTNRLLVRESVPEDVDEFYRMYADHSITRYMEDLYEDREEEVEYIRAYADQIYDFYGYGMWTVILKETGKVIGRAGLSVRAGCDIPELGFLIDAAYHRQGFAFEVCSAILKYARQELKFDRVQAVVDKQNKVSMHLLEKLGFHYERDFDQSGRDCSLLIKIF